ncbi:UDP-N-acetylmuramoyl-L-alanine--D-glutamate ligase [Ruminococcaceae bacterium OttesenSCG-928-A16]|nr:UDP-N-acetylmuramoyl-L-alanine--D-glutamate ligase [Ruminococcaceae bacterium OttesenSCG-928-A16]
MTDFFSTLRGKKVAFIGAGVSHKQLIPMFAKAGAQVTLCDKRPLASFEEYGQTLQALGVRLCLGENYLNGLVGQNMILRTPGFEFFTPALQQAGQNGALLTSEMELFFEYCPCRTIGITGSDGKTTTTSVIAATLQAAGHTVHLGGNIGRPLLPIVNSIAPTDIAVVELSSFQLISMRHSPNIAVVTNVTPNHLDHHKDMAEYVDAKRNILLYQQPNSIAVLGYQNQISRGMQADVKGECRFFSRLQPVENGAFLRADGQLCLAKQGEVTPILPQSEVALRGLHNIENLLAAFAALQTEVPPEAMAQVARTFNGVEHRIEPVRTLNGVQWFNDSIATSPTRVIAGLRAFTQKLIVIAGGYDKGIPFEPMAQDVVERVKTLILMGPTAPKIEAAITAQPGFAQSGLVILHAKNLPDAVAIAAAQASNGDIVTLSPACASFDAYPNFEERGKHFKQLVNAL